ncbi:MAG: response regulator, partial [Blastocatellia bacterium]
MVVELSPEAGRNLISIPRILVIDDDSLMGEALLTTLSRIGFNVELARTGAEGLQRLMNGEHFDMLLLDLMLPELDGWTVLSRVRGTPSTSHLPVI